MVWVFEDVTERRRIEHALAAAKDAVEAASRAKSAFLASTSHEIRTPLNRLIGLIGLTRLALAPQADDVECQCYLPQILDSAESLAEIMGEILDMSKIESGKLEIEEVTFDLHALLRALHETYSAVAEGRGIKCTLDIDAGLPRIVEGDPVRTRQILSNYLTNALEFTDAGAIDIQARVGASQSIVLAVRDTGIGLTNT